MFVFYNKCIPSYWWWGSLVKAFQFHLNMTRHARNCTAGAVYTYQEKKKDAAASGYGTDNQRVGKDSIKDFDCCCLTLQPCRNPVVTQDGYLYDKEAILEYIIKKKNEYSRKLKEYEMQKKKEENELIELANAEKLSKVKVFLTTEKNIVTEKLNHFKNGNSEGDVSGISNMSEGRDKKLPSFWIPSMTPEARRSKNQKPDKTIFCPMSGKPLKVKDLVPVIFTEVKDPNTQSIVVKKVRYMCPITHDILSNSVPCAVLKPTGDVITLECFEKIIKKDWIHPLTGQKLKESDIILLQRGGTGYSKTNDKLEAKNERPVIRA